jgi:hypothetical protein
LKNCKNIPRITRSLLLAAAIAAGLLSLFPGVALAGVTAVGYTSNVDDRIAVAPSILNFANSLNSSIDSNHFSFRPGNQGVQFYSVPGRVSEETYSDMAKRYHYHDDKKIDFIVYTDRSKFLQESPSRDAIGYAIPAENKIAVLLDGSDYQRWQSTIAHEINHIIFIQSVPDIKTVPQWFIEGLAIYESHPGPQASAIEEQALAKDLPDIISNRPSSGPAELKDYGQGYLLVGFIVREFGREALDGIIGRLQHGDTFNNAVLKTIKMSPEELNSRSKEYVGIELFYIWLLKLQDFEWYFATALFLLASGLAFRRKRKNLKRQAGDEQDDDNENEFDGVDFGDGAIV